MFWEPSSEHKDTYVSIISDQINALSKFIFEQLKILNINSSLNRIEKEIKNNYSFYWYHYLNVQLQYIKFWQLRLKDLEMLLIGLQTIIQAFNYLKRLKNEEFSVLLGNKLPKNISINEANISATSISDITGIPRATCIRKLGKLVMLGFLLREAKTKRYYVNQNSPDRTKNITTKDNVNFTIDTFSKFLTLALNNLMHVKK